MNFKKSPVMSGHFATKNLALGLRYFNEGTRFSAK
jgi:hypothetical protein